MKPAFLGTLFLLCLTPSCAQKYSAKTPQSNSPALVIRTVIVTTATLPGVSMPTAKEIAATTPTWTITWNTPSPCIPPIQARRQWLRDIAPYNGWDDYIYRPLGSLSSQQSGNPQPVTEPWLPWQQDHKIQGTGQPGLGPRGWIKSSGSWDLGFFYGYPGRPPAPVYHVTYRIICPATSTGPVWTKTSGDGYHTAVAKVTRQGKFYVLRFSTVPASAEVEQKSSLFAWSGTADIHLTIAAVVPDSSSVWTKP